MSENYSFTSVVVAMSGGLDSSVAAAILKNKGWRVTGLHFLLPGEMRDVAARRTSARDAAQQLDIPLDIVDLGGVFKKMVIEPFVREYLEGTTPNPCVRCNRRVKFEYLVRYAESIGFDCVATGHYARLKRSAAGTELLRGLDRRKEQSYFLHRLDGRVLSRCVFPLGGISKKEARSLAGDVGLSARSADESQEICFISGNDYRGFVEAQGRLRPSATGHIVDTRGKVLGEHEGFFRYTIGQRQGLGISSSRPYYVKEIRPGRNEIVVSRREGLYSRHVCAVRFIWIGSTPTKESFRAEAQIRYRHKAAPGRIRRDAGKGVHFIFDEPQWAVTPGQALVCYEGERVLGGGWIKKAP